MNLYNVVTKKITLGALLVVGLVGLFIYVLFGLDKSVTQEVEENQANQPPLEIEKKPQNIVGSDSLANIVARGENLECSIDYVQEPDMDKIQGTYFTSNGRSRGDFVLSEGVVSSMIVNGDVIYVWSELEGEKYGVKAKLSDLETDNESSVEFKKPIPDDVKVRYNCKTWTTIDGSIFEPPTDILFTEFNRAVDTGMEYSTIYEDAEAGIVLPEL